MSVFDELALAGIVPVIKVDSALDATPLCAALDEGGLPVAEITFRTAAAAEAISRVKQALPHIILGAGTVLTIEQVKRAVDAGAQFIVSPGLNPVVVGYCVQNDIPVLPGCATPGDIETALSFGLDTVKFFPAEAAGGIKYIKAISAPYDRVKFVPTGGVNEKNAAEYLSFPKVTAVGGSWMVPSESVKARDWARITELAKAAMRVVMGASLMHMGINCSTPENAEAASAALSDIMGLTPRASERAIFAGAGADLFEFMKVPSRGSVGHIGVGVLSVARAKWQLGKLGYAFDESSAAYSADGSLKFIYLADEIAGYAVHLIQRN